MSPEYAIEIIRIVVVIFLGLLGIVWSMLNTKISRLEKTICDVPSTTMQKDIMQIKTDIDWIKKSIVEKKL